jgi:hypothetical protein
MFMCVGLPGRRSIGPGLIFLCFFFVARQKEQTFKDDLMIYVLSFACAKERTKEKHTGNDVQPCRPDSYRD